MDDDVSCKSQYGAVKLNDIHLAFLHGAVTAWRLRAHCLLQSTTTTSKAINANGAELYAACVSST